MTLYTQYNRTPHDPETNLGEEMVEKESHVDLKKRVENMMLAGQRLVEARKQQFDFPEGVINETFNDPTRSGNFDLADASTTLQSIEASIAEAEKQKAEETPESTQEPSAQNTEEQISEEITPE